MKRQFITSRTLVIVSLACFTVATLYAGGIAMHDAVIADHAAQSRHVLDEQHERSRLQNEAARKRVAWQEHLKREAWNKAHPEIVARRKQEAAARALRLEQELQAQRRLAAAARAQQERKDAEARRAAEAAAAAREAAAADQIAGKPECLKVKSWKNVHSTINEGWVRVKGAVVNTCDRDFSYVQISFSLYNESGANAGTAFANNNNLHAGETWDFEANGHQVGDGGGTFSFATLVGY